MCFCRSFINSNMKHDNPIQTVIDHASSVIGLRICFHDDLGLAQLPVSYCRHEHPACLRARKNDKARRCIDFDCAETHGALRKNSEGRIHTCPYGLTEIAVPVSVGNVFAGALFAGPCWTQDKACPYSNLIVPKSEEWLEERRTMLLAVSARISMLLTMNNDMLQTDVSRKMIIIDYLGRNLAKTVSVDDMAAKLSLSPSRTSYVVKKIFNMSLPNLHNMMKLNQAVHYLVTSDLTIGEIAERSGFEDPNYFSRVFRKRYEISPIAYRKKYHGR